MFLSHIDNVNPGDRLGKPLYDENGRLLISSGYAMSDAVVQRLRGLGYQQIYLDDHLTGKVKPDTIISEASRIQIIKKLREINAVFKGNEVIHSLDPRRIRREVYSSKKLHKVLHMKEFRRLAGQLLDDLSESRAGFFTHNPMRATENDPYEHAVDVAVLSLLISQKLSMEWEDMLSIGTAALLHDVGKTILLEAFSARDTIPEEKRAAALRDHPVFSMLMVKNADPASFKEQITIEEHHERLDGSGYPAKIRGGDNHPAEHPKRGQRWIYRFARIVAVADEYDNLVNGRNDYERVTPDIALAKLIKRSGVLWNSHVIRALVETVQPYATTTPVVVRRSEKEQLVGFSGVVVQTNTNHPLRPTVLFLKDSKGKEVKPTKVEMTDDRLLRLQIAV